MKPNNDSWLRREISPKQLVTVVAFLYSLVTISTLAPSIGSVTPTTVLLVYYILVPGYCVTLLFDENYDILQLLLFSIFISISLSLSLLAINHITSGLNIPLPVSMPVISIGTIVYYFYFHKR